MSFHVLVFQGISVGSVYNELRAQQDGKITINPATNRFWMSRKAEVFAAWIGSQSAGGLNSARLYTQYEIPREIRPLNFSELPPTTIQASVADWRGNPLEVPPQQELIYDARAVGSGCWGLAWMTEEGLQKAPRGKQVILRGDVSGAVPIANAWTDITSSMTWSVTLPPGEYAIVGSRCESPNGLAHRWILEGSQLRPGGLSQPGPGTVAHSYQESGELGDWGHFFAPAMPRLEVYCEAVDATMTVILQAVRL